jgi:hypothetical protein
LKIILYPAFENEMFLQRRNCYEPWLVKFRVVQLQIMEKQKQITNPIIHQHNSTLCGISSNAGSMVVKFRDSLVHGCYSLDFVSAA